MTKKKFSELRRQVVLPAKTGKAKTVMPHNTPGSWVCTRCDGSGVDPEVAGCSCDCCGGTGEESAT